MMRASVRAWVPDARMGLEFDGLECGVCADLRGMQGWPAGCPPIC